ncbi:uncharacterized membrane protein YuzA (DUF378 family) [Sphingomonas vulcanisoli]|uniref:Uncharacterized membrane protein YuzA (DUF378 family) n=1 Tax=Sphingomonas vulcanisoli TaxID=1658060 RepID=A0ABX0TNC8_9SPHN|nr:hypothetical protein [Sphingomonas vulcanisoli]NIJ07021.1 uncharacterized membrane protein YuzA (DUF378 family) [Sphingomonas vulcanisoli]
MHNSTAVSTLVFATLGIALVIAIFLLIRFLRKPSHRHAMENQRERNIDEIQRGVPPER